MFFSGRVFESHPLTIMSAPPRTSCFSDRSLLLGARVNGDWTRALNNYVREAAAQHSVSVIPSEPPISSGDVIEEIRSKTETEKIPQEPAEATRRVDLALAVSMCSKLGKLSVRMLEEVVDHWTNFVCGSASAIERGML